MPSPVNRARRKKAFNRGYERPQVFNPYKNVILSELWKRGREARLKKTGGVLPPPPVKRERRLRDQAVKPQTMRPRRDRW